jgi:hypothetical protein
MRMTLKTCLVLMTFCALNFLSATSYATCVVTYYQDLDGDTFGNLAVTQSVCGGPPPGFVLDHTDCDDTNIAINTTATETCDGVDNNCNGQTDESFDVDHDGTADCFDVEECDQIDNDGDGDIDEGVQTTFYADADGDDHGDLNATQDSCSPNAGYVASSDDCDDTDATINPDADEICGDSIDQNCDGADDVCAVIADSADNSGSTADDDADGIENDLDNCPSDANADQLDTDSDGIGDVCDEDANGDGFNDNTNEAIDSGVGGCMLNRAANQEPNGLSVLLTISAFTVLAGIRSRKLKKA